MTPSFQVGDTLQINFTSIQSGAPVERVGAVVHVIAPGEVPDMRWYQKEGGAWSDGVHTPWLPGNPVRRVPACSVFRYVVEYAPGDYHVVPDGAIHEGSVAWQQGYRVKKLTAQ